MDDIWDSILNLDELVLTNTPQERNSILINKNDRTALFQYLRSRLRIEPLFQTRMIGQSC